MADPIRQDPAVSTTDSATRASGTTGANGPVTSRPHTTSSTPTSQVKTASGIDLLLGIWLILAPFILLYENIGPFWNDIVVGILVAALAGYRIARPVRTAGASWTNVGIGVWLLIAPWILNYSATPEATWNDIIVGLLVIVCASWSAIATPHTPVREPVTA